MGFVTSASSPSTARVAGAILQMFNHGITTGALFLFVGLIYERPIPAASPTTAG